MADYIPNFEDTTPVEERVPTFEETKSLEPKFEETEEKPQMEWWRAAIAGASQGLTAGTADEILGFVTAGWDSMQPDQKEDFWKLYRQNQEMFQKRAELAKEQHPGVYWTSDIAASILGPGKFVKGAKSVAALAGAEAVARQEAPITEDITQTALNAAIGAGLGYGIAKPLELLGKRIGAVTEAKSKQRITEIAADVNDRMYVNKGTLEEIGSLMNNKQLKKEIIETDQLTLDSFKEIAKESIDSGKLKLSEYTPTFKNIKRKSTSIVRAQEEVDKLPVSDLDKMKLLYSQGVSQADVLGSEATVRFINDMSPELSKALKSKTPTAESVSTLVTLEAMSKHYNVDAATYMAYKTFRGELSQLSYFLRKSKPPKTLGNQTSPSRLFATNRTIVPYIRQGMVNDSTYKLAKQQQYAFDVVHDTMMVRQANKFGGLVDPASNKIKKAFYDLRYMLSEIDDTVGTDIAVLADDLHVKNNLMGTFQNRWFDVGDTLIELREKSKMTPEELYQLLTNRKYRASQWKSLTPDAKKTVREWRIAFEQLRRTAEKDHDMIITKLANYAPQKTVEPAELVVRLGKWAEDADIVESMAGLHITDPIGQAVKENGSLAELVTSLQNLYDEKIVTKADYIVAVKKLQDVLKTKSSLGYEVAATFRRTGKVPDRILETNIDKLWYSYVNNISKGAYLNLPLKALEAQYEILKEVGLPKAAKYLDEYLLNMAGVPTGLAKQVALWRANWEVGVKEFFTGETALSRAGQATALNIPAMMFRITQSIYPNALGFNPKSVMLNWTQPFMMTATEVGAGGSSVYGQKVAIKAAKRALVTQAQAGLGFFSEARKILNKKGLAPPVFTGEGYEAMKLGIRGTVPKMLHKFLKKEEEFAMSLFQHADYNNRLVSSYMAEDVVGDLFEGAALSKLGKPLKKEHIIAKAFISRMEPGYRSRLQSLLKHNATRAEVENTVAQYLISKTQFVYGKAGMHEFGRRMGPLFAMFTKFPASVGSDIFFRLKTRGAEGAAEVGSKYLAPLIALMTVDAFYKYEDAPRSRELLGPQGFTSFAPVYSIMDAQGFVAPPIAQTGYDIADELVKLSQKPENAKQIGERIKTKLGRAASSYVPSVGRWYNTYRRINPLLFNKEKE
jgi:hypothetical protein